MTLPHSDALVFFGATGDLAYKKILPALQAMVRLGRLNAPVIGVAKADWNLDHLKARARDSVEKHGGLDSSAFDKLCGLLRYVDGDYNDPATFQSIRKELGPALRPAHYLAIPPILFGLVVEQLAKSDCNKGARVIVENPLAGTSPLSRNSTEFCSVLLTRSQSFASTIILGRSLSIICFSSASQTRPWSQSGTVNISKLSRSLWRKLSGSRVGALSMIKPARSAT